MVMRFSHDDDSYWDAKLGLLAELAERLGPGHDPSIVGNAGLLLDWKYNYGDGELDSFSVGELREFLLEWCPRKVSARPEDYLDIVHGAKEWIVHLALTDQWRGGLVAPVLRLCDEIVPAFLAAMSDPSKFGMAKGMFMGPALGGVDIDFDDPESIQAAMDAFNALSFEERKALTDPYIATGFGSAESDGPFESPGTDLPLTLSPDPLLIAEQAAAAPLVAQVDRVRTHLAGGVKLTATGNPKLVDAKVLMELFETEDRWEYTIGGSTRTTRSANDLPHMLFLLEVVIAAGALESNGRTLKPAPGWDAFEPVQRCERLLSCALDIGAVSRGVEFRYANGSPNFFDARYELLDSGALHLIVPAFVVGEVETAAIVGHAADVIAGELGRIWPHMIETSRFDEYVERDVERGLDLFARLGMIRREDQHEVTDSYSGEAHLRGGTVIMEDLGRHLLAPLLPTLGYVVHTSHDLAGLSAGEVVAVLAAGPGDVGPAEVWEAWAGDSDPADKVDELLDVLSGSAGAPERLALMALLQQVPGDVCRRVESLIDGPYGAYALIVLDSNEALAGGSTIDPADIFEEEPFEFLHELDLSSRLLTDGRAIDEVMASLPPEVSLAPLVDMLWAEMDLDPESLIEHVVSLDEGSGVPGGVVGPGAFTVMLDDLWRVKSPETAELLEFVGANHPVKATAKAARKALLRHRSAGHGRGSRG